MFAKIVYYSGCGILGLVLLPFVLIAALVYGIIVVWEWAEMMAIFKGNRNAYEKARGKY